MIINSFTLTYMASTHHFQLSSSASNCERFHSTYVKHISVWSFQIPTTGMWALHQTSFSQLLLLIWKHSEFISKHPARVKYYTHLPSSAPVLVHLTTARTINTSAWQNYTFNTYISRKTTNKLKIMSFMLVLWLFLVLKLAWIKASSVMLYLRTVNHRKNIETTATKIITKN